MHLNTGWPNPCHAKKNTKYISTCDEQSVSMPERTKMYLNFCWPNPLYDKETKKCISTCFDHASEDTKWIKPILFQHGRKNLCWQNRSHASEDTKYTITLLVLTPSIHGKAKSLFHFPCQRRHESYLNLGWRNACNLTRVDLPKNRHILHLNMCRWKDSHASEYIKYY